MPLRCFSYKELAMALQERPTRYVRRGQETCLRREHKIIIEFRTFFPSLVNQVIMVAKEASC